jgi:hypothetical protein
MVALAVFTSMLAVPISAGGQVDEITVTPGPWEGSVMFAGSTRQDASNDSTVRFATSSTITIDMVVDEKGNVTSGSMQVDISWVHDSVGTPPGGGDLYHVTSDQQQTGTLALSGTVQLLVATGTLNWVYETFDTDGNSVFDGPVARAEDQVWIFEALQSDCGLLTGSVVDVRGIGLMRSVILPEYYVDDGATTTNELLAVSRIWSKSEAFEAEEIATNVAIINELANSIIASEVVTAQDLVFLVLNIENLQKQMASLEACELEALGFPTPEAGEDFLAELLRNLLFKALANAGELDTKELLTLLNIGARAGALTGPEEAVELFEGFEQALTEKLAEAVDGGYYGDVEDIAVAAGSHGFTDLYADATKALEGEP